MAAFFLDSLFTLHLSDVRMMVFSDLEYTFRVGLVLAPLHLPL